MRIVIDLQGAQTESRFRGIGRYTLSLAKAIIRNRREHHVQIAISGLFPETIEPIRAAFDGLLPQENIRVWYAPGPVNEGQPGNNWRREAAECIREAFLASLEPDVIFITSLFEGFFDDAVTSIGVFDNLTPVVAMLYDLIPLLNQEQYLRPSPAYEQHYMMKLKYLRRARAWLAISEASSSEGIDIGLDPGMIINISAACDDCFKPTDISSETKVEVLNKYGIVRPFMLYSGGGDSRKNLHRLIRAYGRLSPDMRSSHQLVLAGRIHGPELTALQSTASSAGLSGNELVLTGYIPDEELVVLYNSCRLFVFPSWYEGFGLPVLEAMSCGAPVIAGNVSSIPEVIERMDALFDPFSEKEIAFKIVEVLKNGKFREELIRHGLKQARKFSWGESARQAISAFERLANRHQSPKRALLPPRRPTLAYISPLPPERSGISDYSAELLPELARNYDIEVIVAQPEVSDRWIRACLPIRSVDYFMKNADHFERVLYHFGNSTFHQHMFGLLDRVPGVVVLHDFYLGHVYEWMEHVLPGTWTRELYNSHGYKALWDKFNKNYVNEVVFKYPCNFSVLERALGIIVHSNYSVELADQWYGDSTVKHFVVIPMLRGLTKKVERDEARRKLGLHTDDFVVCSFGVLGPIKQNQRLLKAFLNSEMSKDPRCKLIFVGENDGGEYGRELLENISRSKLKERIIITGWVDADIMHNYFSAADLAVQLRTISRGESSAAVLDCMNHALPTVVNSNGSLSELPSDAVWKLPDKFKCDELIKAMETLWHDPDIRLALGARACEKISTEHTPRLCADMYARAIEAFYNGAENCRASLINELVRSDNLPAEDSSFAVLASSIAQSLPFGRSAHQILVDISALAQIDLKTGIQRVTRSILRELLLNQPAGYRVEPVYSSLGQNCYRYAREFTLRFFNCPVSGLRDDPIDANPGDIFLGLDLHQDTIVAQVSYLQSLRNAGVRIFFIVYDILPILKPEEFPPAIEEIHKNWLSSICCLSDGIICISQTVADEVAEWLKKNDQKRLRPLEICWFHIGADIENSMPTLGLPEDAHQVLAQLSACTSFLMVGTVEPRKGYLQTIAAFEQLWDSGVDANLVIVGKEGWKDFPEELRRTIPEIVSRLHHHPELGRRLFWLEDISDEYLEKIYSTCSCLIAASEGEGFGLPLIEAAQHKLPIIARDIPVFKEVANGYAFYFDGAQPNNLAQAIKKWIVLHQNRKHPTSDAMPWLTWKESTEQLKHALFEASATIDHKLNKGVH
jgi:glycosyltransferase involved in cell wall biosynthesis